MQPGFWGFFHDGHIRKIEGHVPGDLVVRVGVLYLREMFPGVGAGFTVHLLGCTLFEFQEYDEAPTSDLREIESREPELLYVEPSDPVSIDCATGRLTLRYELARVFLDSGESITYEDLQAASTRYWEEWKRSWQERS